ncbi:MAG TPA: hypothetical protein VLA75_10440 [Thermoanaerobaculia bacterium]|nr:hypothetical protein [Thermoanaerobaculia bacterium]
MREPARAPSHDPREILRPWLDREPGRPAAAARERVAARLGARQPRPLFALALLAVGGFAIWLAPRPGSPPPSPGEVAPVAVSAPVAESRTLVIVLSSGTRLVVPLDPAP